LFAAVYGPSEAEDQYNTYQRIYPRARVRPTFWQESDTILAGKTVVTVDLDIEVTAAISTQDDDPEEATDQLIEAVKEQLTGADLGAGSVPRLTRVLQGKYVVYGLGSKRIDSAAQPVTERRVWFRGQCAYIKG
jgi:hypothetical protein